MFLVLTPSKKLLNPKCFITLKKGNTNAQNQVAHLVTIPNRKFITTLTLSMWILHINVQTVQPCVQLRMLFWHMGTGHTRTSRKKRVLLAICQISCSFQQAKTNILFAQTRKLIWFCEKEREAADAQIQTLLQFNPEVKRWFCVSCSYNHQARQVVYKHVDSKHMDIVYKCDQCDKLSPTQHALSEHVRSTHKQMLPLNMLSPFW